MLNKIVVIGAGIAGLSCIEALFQDLEEARSCINQVVLLSDSRLIKRITNFKSTGRQLDSFDVTECSIEEFNPPIPEGVKFSFILGSVRQIEPKKKIVILMKNNEIREEISYDKLCICLGSRPRQLDLMNSCSKNVRDRIIVIRDTDTVVELQRKLNDCKSLVIVGNGGISIELVSKVNFCDKTWIIRDNYMGYSYFDSGAAKFLLDSVESTDSHGTISKLNRMSYSEFEGDSQIKTNFGPSLGPNWLNNLNLSGKYNQLDSKFDIIYEDEVIDVIENNVDKTENSLKVITRKGKEILCDLVALAIGVTPNSLQVVGNSLELSSSDGGILIDNEMRTSIENVYAAGDIVSCENWTDSELWFQMRLWTQARQMGYYAGKCIYYHNLSYNPKIYANFDCFTHCTTFFGFKIILLGRYNNQFLNSEKKCEVIARVNPGKDYVKLIITDGRIIGAVLIGDSGLEETIENLIHDRMDISRYKDQLLDETADIDDYFD